MTHDFSHRDHCTADQQLDLLYGLLDEDEMNRVLAHMSSCPDCESEFQKLFARNEQLAATRVLHRSPSGELRVEGMRSEDQPEARRRLPRLLTFPQSLRPRWAWSTAAAAILVLIAIGWWPTPNPAELSPYRLPPPSRDMQSRIERESGPDQELMAGLEAYGRDDLAEAIDLLSRARAQGTHDTVRRIYLGNALAFRGEHQRAIDVLSSVTRQSLPDPWGSDARWNLCLAFSKCGRQASADSLLDVFAQEPGEAGDRARALR